MWHLSLRACLSQYSPRREGWSGRTCYNAMASHAMEMTLIFVVLASVLAQQPPVPVAVLQPGAASTAGTASQQQCVSQVAVQLQSSCSQDLTITGREEVFKRLVSRTYAACLEDGNATATNSTKALQAMVPYPYYAAYTHLASAFTAQTGIQVFVNPVDRSQLVAEATFEHSHNLSMAHQVWILDTAGSYALSRIQALTNLRRAVDADASAANVLRWQDDVPQAIRQLAYYHNELPGAPYAEPAPGANHTHVPVDGSVPLMYYRTDVLAASGLAPPRTWSEVLFVASTTHGKDMNADGTGDYGICWEPDLDCEYAWSFGMVLAPYLQYMGTAQGMLLAPTDVAPLVNRHSAAAALSLYDALLQYASPYVQPSDSECGPGGHAAFRAGRCALTFGWGQLFKSLELSRDADGSPAFARGRYAMAHLPGSESVFLRDEGKLAACTGALCPFGLGGQPEAAELQGRRQLQAVNGSSSSGANGTYINRAPLLPTAGLVGVVSGQGPADRQADAFAFLAFVSAANLDLAANDSSPTMPFRKSGLDAAARDRLVAAGFTAEMVSQYQQLVLEALHHPNTVLGPDIPRIEQLWATLGQLAYNSTGPADVEGDLDAAEEQIMQEVVHYQGTAEWTRTLLVAYQGYLNFSTQATNGTADSEKRMPTVSLAVPIASALAVVLISTIYELKKHRTYRSLFGKVVAPGPFEDTTLLVTDIQDSTALWEMLPSHIMDEAIKEHHLTIRRLLLKHAGYESATEGDSFLLAFHCPEDALLFAMEAQVALLECDWLPELLDCDICKPYYVAQNEQDSKRVAGLLADGGEGTARLMAVQRTHSSTSNKSASQQEEASSGAIGTATGTGSGALSGLPIGPNALGGFETNTFVGVCASSWKEASSSTPNNVLIFRGLRVRMGMHTGIHNDADVAYNKAAARMQYGGEILQYAKAVGDAAAGGMILLGEATYRLLPMDRLWDKAMVMHMGEYRLKDSMPVLPLYQVTGRRLLGRLGHLHAMRYQEQTVMGALSAPLGTVTLASLVFVGMSTLLEWDPVLAREGLALLKEELEALLKKWGGYLADVSDEGLVAAFPSPSDALQWALGAHQALLEVDWPPDLLDHELCEELVVGETVVFRGVRVKTGVDSGALVGEVNALTGRITYRGKPVIRAERIAGNASSNQVLCSQDAWNQAQAQAGPTLALRGISADRLGPFKLRGILEKVEVMQVRLLRRDPTDGWAEDLVPAGETNGAGPRAAVNALLNSSGRKRVAGGAGSGSSAAAADGSSNSAQLPISLTLQRGMGGCSPLAAGAEGRTALFTRVSASVDGSDSVDNGDSAPVTLAHPSGSASHGLPSGTGAGSGTVLGPTGAGTAVARAATATAPAGSVDGAGEGGLAGFFSSSAAAGIRGDSFTGFGRMSVGSSAAQGGVGQANAAPALCGSPTAAAAASTPPALHTGLGVQTGSAASAGGKGTSPAAASPHPDAADAAPAASGAAVGGAAPCTPAGAAVGAPQARGSHSGAASGPRNGIA